MRRENANPMGQLVFYGTAPIFTAAQQAGNFMKIKD